MTTVKPQISFLQVGLIVFAVLVAMAVANMTNCCPQMADLHSADGSFSVELPVSQSEPPSPVKAGARDELVSVKPTKSTAYMCSYVEMKTSERNHRQALDLP